MNKFWLLLLLFISFQSILAQEVKHATTVEQCRADQKLWLSEAGQTYVSVPFDELTQRNTVMLQCTTVDRVGWNDYYNTIGETNAERVMRLRNFLERHNLWNQFLAEDAQGKR